MANILTPSRAPSCLNCLRRTIIEDGAASFQTPWRMQWRGKKKLPKSSTITVRLLRDVPRYGPKGSLINIPQGTMRNEFFSSRRAAYLTMEEKKQFKDQATERDYLFGVQLPPGSQSKVDQILARPTPGQSFQRPAVSPARAEELLQKFIPPTLEYFRSVIQTPPVTPGNATNPEVPNADVPTTALLGVVSTADVATSIKSILADGAKAQGESQAGRIMIDPESIKFVGAEVVEGSAGTDPSDRVDRVRALGDYEVVIQLGGGHEIKRRIRVLPEAAPEELLSQPEVGLQL